MGYAGCGKVWTCMYYGERGNSWTTILRNLIYRFLLTSRKKYVGYLYVCHLPQSCPDWIPGLGSQRFPPPLARCDSIRAWKKVMTKRKRYIINISHPWNFLFNCSDKNHSERSHSYHDVPVTVWRTLQIFPHLILSVTMWSRFSYSFYFTNRETEVLGG